MDDPNQGAHNAHNTQNPEGGDHGEGGDDYRVGPGKPPREHQWKKGQSGNPGGRPKDEGLQAILRRRLSEEHNGKSIGEIVVDALIKGAAQGKAPHIKEILDRTEGKVADRMKIEGAEGKIVVLNVVPPRVVRRLGDPPEAEAPMDRTLTDQALREAAAQAPPGSKVIKGDWPLRV